MATEQFGVMCLSWIAVLIGGGAYGEDLRTVAQSPYRIQTYVQTHNAFSASDLWRALGIPDLVTDRNVEARGFDCRPNAPCEIWLQQVPLSTDGTRFMALRFTQPGMQLDRYLLFHQQKTGWKLAGHIDSGFAKYFDPVLYPKEVGGKSWLVLREQSGSGTGYQEAIQRWFEVKGGRLREVLSILDDAYILGHPGEYVLRPSAIVMDFQRTGTGDLLRVLYRLVYALVDDDGVDRAFFGSIEKSVTYRRNRNETSFHLDAGASENDMKVFGPNLGQDLATEFLKNDFQNLLKISRGPRSTERRWLEENLKDFPPSAEREELRRALTAGTAR